MSARLLFVSASLILVGICTSANAGTLVDTIGVGGDTLRPVSSLAAGQSFVATGSGISDVELELALAGSSLGSIVLTIAADNNNAPGAVVNSIFTLAETSIPTAATLFDFTNIAVNNLTVGSKYWLTVARSGTVSTEVALTTSAPAVGTRSTAGTTGTTDYWSGSKTGLITASLMTCISTDRSCGTNHVAALVDTFTLAPSAPPPLPPVAEPASLAIMGVGAAGLGLMRRRKSRQSVA